MFCPKCGNKLEGNESFCSVCGTCVQPEEEQRFELETLEYEYQRLLKQKEQGETLERDIEMLRKEIRDILYSVEDQTFKHKNRGIRFCPWCGAPAENARFCSQCGRNIQGDQL